ncbi:Gfo/Idh/MocA family oxidoreductase [filamentous cyanobacterium LEGE 11480]|uniref:Gfo/Idh/MocA family oxidoreductase n=1 Tax=Romeriopsis navalis LEGE 11480 TaxID=2777977 RepID=A0A928VK52_9CYAN|nr:Gfo/Idh/MocA family oxidoreductase [Romeriopsis navalis]MBE9029127.1 Gfo/Idh/MocA family oxidoreductase [Romeriopsis navalis LEGE 11480]
MWNSHLANTPNNPIGPTLTLRVGLIGWHQLSRPLIQVLTTIPAIELVGISHIDDTQLNPKLVHSGEKGHNCAPAIFEHYADLLPHIDAVCLALPSWHPAIGAIGLTCLKAGISVIGEHPSHTTLSMAEQLVQAATQHQCILQLGGTEPGEGALQALGQVLSNATVCAIETLHTGPCRSPDRDLSVVFDLLIHDIEHSLSIAQSSIVNITASGTQCDRSGQLDYVTATINFANGRIATLTARHTEHYKQHQITAHCQDAYIQADLRTNQVLIHRQSSPPSHNRTYQQAGWTERVATLNQDPRQTVMTQFFQHVRDGNCPTIAAAEMLQALRIATLIEARAKHVIRQRRSRIQPVAAAPMVIAQ